MDYEFLFRRQHPDYRRNRETFLRCQAAYAGGEAYLRQALVQHVSEVDVEFAERLHRAYYFNYPRKIARLITQYVLSTDPQRTHCDADLIEDFSSTGLRVNEVMRQFSTLLNVFGCAYLAVGMPDFTGLVDAERKMQEKLRPSVRVLSPLAVVDWQIGSDGKYDWLLLEETRCENPSPFAEPIVRRQRKLWTRDRWQLFERTSDTGSVVLRAEGANTIGEIPVVRGEEPDGFGIGAPHWFRDVVRISDAILNNESEAQMNLLKQMFGLLVISENFARGAKTPDASSRSDGTSMKFSHVLARSAAIWESPEERGISRYISPSGVETQMIRSENKNLKEELFDVIGMTILRETRELQSAASKAWDHQLIRQFLVTRVDLLEQCEFAAWQLMQRYDSTVPLPEISYNRDFSVLDLKEAIEGILDLQTVQGGAEYQKELARTALFLLNRYKKIEPARLQKISEEIDKMA